MQDSLKEAKLAKLLNVYSLPEKELYFLVKQRLKEGFEWDFGKTWVYSPLFWVKILDMLVDSREEKDQYSDSVINFNFPQVFSEDKFKIKLYSKNFFKEEVCLWKDLHIFLKREKLFLAKGIFKIEMQLLNEDIKRKNFENFFNYNQSLVYSFYDVFIKKVKSVELLNLRKEITVENFIELDDVYAWRHLLNYACDPQKDNQQLIKSSKKRAEINLRHSQESVNKFKKQNWAETVNLDEILEYALLMP